MVWIVEEQEKELYATKSKISFCDNCGFQSIIEKKKGAICPNCNKPKLLTSGSAKENERIS